MAGIFPFRFARPVCVSTHLTRSVFRFHAEKGFEDGEMVHENKVIWFLNERMLNRELRRLQYVRMRRAADGAPIKQPPSAPLETTYRPSSTYGRSRGAKIWIYTRIPAGRPLTAC